LNVDAPHFGSVLRSARERRGYSLQEIAARTKVSSFTLGRLEDGAFDDLPPDVFVRGFIQSYARVVGTSSAEVLELYDEALDARRAAAANATVRVADVVGMPQDDAALDDEGAPRRGIGVAVFVIIVLLLASITLSLFLRQPPQPGEGLSLGAPAPSWDDTPSTRAPV
jgi:cytoskeletal protein RodZ